MKSYSQHGEDIFMSRLVKDHEGPHWIVDVGANDGRSWSNSYLFVQRGYHALLVEPMPNYAAQCRALHHGNDRIIIEECAIANEDGFVTFWINQDRENDLLAMRSSLDLSSIPGGKAEEVKVRSSKLSALLLKHGIPKHYDILSVDAEMRDLNVLETAKLDTWKPQIICVEDEMNAGPIGSYLASFDYKLTERLGPNGIYLPSAGRGEA
jgi:FkbM family methyltransferase